MVDTDRYDIPGDMKDYVMHHSALKIYHDINTIDKVFKRNLSPWDLTYY